MLPADGKLAAAKMEFINTRTSARPYRQLEEQYTLTFMLAMPDGAAADEPYARKRMIRLAEARSAYVTAAQRKLPKRLADLSARARKAGRLQGTSTDAVVKADHKAACAVELVARPGSSRTEDHARTRSVGDPQRLRYARASFTAMQQIADWLQKLGLGQYAQRFAENEIDVSVLPHLTDQDLKDIARSAWPTTEDTYRYH